MGVLAAAVEVDALTFRGRGKALRRARQAAACDDWTTDRGIGRYPEGEAARELAALRAPIENKAPGADWTCHAAK